MSPRCLLAIAIPFLLPAQNTIPRMPDGKPNLSGVWQGGSTRKGSWDEANSGLGVGGTGRDPNAPPSPASQQVVNQPAPYQPWAAKKVLESYKKRGIDDPSALCLPPGVPRLTITGLFPVQIVQTRGASDRSVRIHECVPHHSDSMPSTLTIVGATYMGDSVAHWEGDTLVVDVTNFNDKTWLTGTGTFHTDALHVTERYTRIDKDRINYDVTMDDPKVLTSPWTIHTSLMLREGTRVQEYVCAENNLDPAHYEELLKNGVKFSR